MASIRPLCLGVLAAACVAVVSAQQIHVTRTGVPQPGEKGGQDISGPYEVVLDWPKPLHGNNPGDWSWGRTPSVWAESPDRIWVLQSGELPIMDKPIGIGGLPLRPAAQPQQVGHKHRQEHTIMCFDRDGRLVDSWPQHDKLIVGPNRIRIDPKDPDKAVWVVNNRSAYKFSHDGKQILLTLTEANGVAFRGL